jgi:hypothetical protein
VVVRASRYPMTNLHLGAARADPDELARRCAPGVFEAALESCRVVARVYDALHVGVDVAITKVPERSAGIGARGGGFGGSPPIVTKFAAHRVLEANAFGDLLHGATLDSTDPYGWEIREALTREGSRGPIRA